jgi:hypothetical protein
MRTDIDNAVLLAGQQVPYTPQWDPMKDPQIEFAMRLHQLALISDRLQKMYEDDMPMLIKIKNANSLLCKGSINTAAYMLQKIVYSQTEENDVDRMHQEIYQEAEKFAADALEEMMNGNFPEILMQKPKNLEFVDEGEEQAGHGQMMGAQMM